MNQIKKGGSVTAAFTKHFTGPKAELNLSNSCVILRIKIE